MPDLSSLLEYLPTEVLVLSILGMIAAAIFCVYQIHTRYRDSPLPKRLLWTVVVLIPLAGPLIYGAFFFGIARNKCTGSDDLDILLLFLWLD